MKASNVGFDLEEGFKRSNVEMRRTSEQSILAVEFWFGDKVLSG
jgi:hypothetical protein